ncbi:Cof-type HAD-IIB family hydrolase [Aquibacillus halophilus]|uniref:Cof-type HAD-IIB family hydrolase n=1 Tax=Aquibacillus halophilus TaxID=930132 RepID=A0A6A8DRN1_9BACI|nr:HAD family hydrolase [Aquibacillus halophilus]MRH43862.1 Cof-type HAD-IIB family hydrolase [Aquibacillus halophilus]
MTNYKAIFLDIDGTILRPDHTIQESTIDAVNQALDQGLEVILATGRPLHEISGIAQHLNIHSCIGYNGAFATYKNKEILNEPMDSKTIDFYLQVSSKHGHEMVLYTNNKNTFTAMDAPVVQQFIDVFQLKKNELFSNSVMDKVLGITLMNLDNNDVDLYYTSDDIYFSQVNVAGLTHSYDVIRESVNKGHAVKAILDHLSIPKENAIAFGDGMNDKEMLQYVGEGFAMGNGHPDIFQYAKHRTTDVTESGIFNGLKSLGLVK